MHLPVTVKAIYAGYLISPYFKDLHLYLAQNKLPSTRTAICKVETLAEKFILLDSLLFKLVTNGITSYTKKYVCCIWKTAKSHLTALDCIDKLPSRQCRLELV